MNEGVFFETSFQNSKMSAEAWRAEAKRQWERIKAAPHYHGGVSCTHYVGCEKYIAPGK